MHFPGVHIRDVFLTGLFRYFLPVLKLSCTLRVFCGALGQLDLRGKHTPPGEWLQAFVLASVCGSEVSRLKCVRPASP
jgi:hypothetical protein